LVSLFLAAACSLAGRGAPGGAVMITPESNGRTIELRLDQELLVRLPGNPAMGYRWSLAAAPAVVLKLEGLPSVERDAAGGSAGAPVVEIWRFTTAHTGRQVLVFDYCLPWETEAPPARQLSFTVTVR
jgi:inhibitor of cysteine peptidase